MATPEGAYFIQDGEFLELDSEGLTPFAELVSRSFEEAVKKTQERFITQPIPQTPSTMYMKSAQKYKSILDATPVKKLVMEYENAKGHVKGKRTLRQRLADMTKMSPKRRQKVLDVLKEELDEETMTVVMNIFKPDAPEAHTPEQKQVRFSADVVEPAPAGDTDGYESELQKLVTAIDPLRRTLPDTNPYGLQMESYDTGSQFQAMATRDADPDVGRIGNFPPSSYLTPQKKTFTKTPASAQSNSPVSVPVQHHHAQHNRQTPTQVIDPSLLTKQPVLVLDSPTPRTPSPVAPPAPAPGSTRTAKKWLPEEETSEQALENFKVPDLCDGSTVTYAQGLKQRQVSKARGGEFEEQFFVVGMRFIVL